MKIRIPIIGDGEDADLKAIVDREAAESGIKPNEEMMRNVLGDYIEISTSLLDDMPPGMQDASRKYIEVMAKKFVINLITALKMSVIVGRGPLDSVDMSIGILSAGIAAFKLQLDEGLRSQKENAP